MGTAAGLLLRTASGWTAISSVGVALVTALVVQLLGQRPDTDRQTTFWIRAFALPLAALLPLSSIMLLALRRSVQSVAAHRILRPILLIATIAFVSFLLQHEVDASDTMMIWALVSLAALGVSVTWIRKHLPTEIADTDPAERRREWLSVAVTLVTNLGLVINKTDVVMLGAIDALGFLRATARSNTRTRSCCCEMRSDSLSSSQSPSAFSSPMRGERSDCERFRCNMESES